jgi:hypothetical protein
MKTRILTLVTVAAMVLGIGTAALADGKNDSANNHEVSTVLNNVSKISKIEVRGNVEVYISDSEADQVKVYNKYYEQTALVQSKNGTLRITSYSDQKLVVWVKAADLSEIAAYDNAEVRSFGKLSPIALKVTLNNNAYAKLDVDGLGMNVTINDRAKADLAGAVTNCTLKYAKSATVNSSQFAAEHLTRIVDAHAATNEYAGL